MTLRHYVTRRRTVWLAPALLIAAVLGGLGWSRSQATVAPDPPPTRLPVDVMPLVAAEGYALEQTFTGTVQARRTSPLSFRRAAELVELRVDQGSRVEANQALARIDSRRLLTEQSRLQARQTEAQAILDELVAGPRLESIAAQRARVADLEAQVQRLTAQQQRRSSLRQQSVISQEDYEQTVFELESMRARCQAAERILDELEAGTRLEQIEAQRAVLLQLQAEQAQIEIELHDSTLVAPFAGWITRRFLDEGVIVSPGQAVLELVEEEPWEVWIGVPPEVAQELQPGSAHPLLVSDATYHGCVRCVLTDLDRSTRTRTAILTLNESTQGRVVPGQLARIRVQRQISTPGYWLPLGGLTRDTGGLWSLLVAQPDGQAGHQVARRLVEVLHTDGDRAYVRGTLADGELAILQGVHRLALGQAVAVP